MAKGTKNPIVARLLQEIDGYEKEADKKWHTDADRIIKRYKDERPSGEATRPRFNVLWSNVETLKPFLYSATPKPVVSARHDDAPAAAQTAAQVLERALNYVIAEEHFGSSLRNVRDDYLLPGRGTAWVRYVPTFVQQAVQISESAITDDPAQVAASAGEGEDGTPQLEEVVGWEEVITDYVHWRDFGHNIAPTWEEVDIVWRRVPMDRDALKKRFGDEIGSRVPLDWRAKDGKSNAEDSTARAAIYECWWKSKRSAFWISKGFDDVLDEQEDPLKLDHFFPCPRPVYATITTDSLIPTPDFRQYRDQANAIDDLTGRIASLTKSIKAVGVYDASVPALQTILQEGHDNTLIPVDSWAALAEKGGLKGAVELLPMQEIVGTLLSLHQARDAQKADLYEVTGMSDIIRGNTNPEETATAQEIKTNFASKRLAERQNAVERFAANMIAIMGNVIAMHFDVKTLIAMTGMKLLTNDQKAQIQQLQAQQAAPPAPGAPPAPPQPGAAPASPMGHNGGPPLDDDILEALDKPTWDDVMELLRNEPQRRFLIKIEDNTLVAPDDAAEQAARIQFLQAVGQFLQQAMEAAQAQPAMVPLLGAMLMFVVKGFRVGRDLVDQFQSFVDRMEKEAAQPQQPKPDPAMAKVQGELQLQQQRQQFEQQQATAKMQADQAQAAHQRALDVADQKHRHRLEIAAAANDVAGSQADQQQSAAQAHIDAAIEQMKASMEQQTNILIARINAFAKIEAAGEAKGATQDTAAEQHEQEQGA